MISLEDLRVVFGRTIALDAITLDIAPGIVGLFGPNAAGKTTLLRVVAGLQPIARGSVMVDGRDPHAPDEDFCRFLGYAGHDSGLYERLTVRENLELFARLHGVPIERLPATIEALDLTGFADTAVASLSAGIKRRAAVARALLHEPLVLLLDEPYANLDDASSETVSQAIRSWHRPGRLAIIATHGAKRVRSFAHAGIVLQRGRVASYREGFRQR